MIFIPASDFSSKHELFHLSGCLRVVFEQFLFQTRQQTSWVVEIAQTVRSTFLTTLKTTNMEFY